MKLRFAISSLVYLLLILLLLFLNSYWASNSIAGTIRNVQVTENQPAIIHLAFGRTTAISFFVKPEKVVAGSPESVEVNFLGKDITLRPVGQHPGNLIVYTQAGRYVILLKIVGEYQYDDVVRIGFGRTTRPVRLLADSFVVREFDFKKTTVLSKKKSTSSSTVFLRLSGDEKFIEGKELASELGGLPKLRCTGCSLKITSEDAQFLCNKTVTVVSCDFQGGSLKIERSK